MQFQRKWGYCFKISTIYKNDSSNISGTGEQCPQATPGGMRLFNLVAWNAMWSPPETASSPCSIWIEFQIPLLPSMKFCWQGMAVFSCMLSSYWLSALDPQKIGTLMFYYREEAGVHVSLAPHSGYRYSWQ